MQNITSSSPLTPGTEYTILVSVVTQRGEGEWIKVVARTGQATGGQLANQSRALSSLVICM